MPGTPRICETVIRRAKLRDLNRPVNLPGAFQVSRRPIIKIFRDNRQTARGGVGAL